MNRGLSGSATPERTLSRRELVLTLLSSLAFISLVAYCAIGAAMITVGSAKLISNPADNTPTRKAPISTSQRPRPGQDISTPRPFSSASVPFAVLRSALLRHHGGDRPSVAPGLRPGANPLSVTELRLLYFERASYFSDLQKTALLDRRLDSGCASLPGTAVLFHLECNRAARHVVFDSYAAVASSGLCRQTPSAALVMFSRAFLRQWPS